MQKSKLLVALLGTLVAMPAMADSPFSANVSLTTDYLFRGISQTGHKPALQGGFDYAGPMGFYAGVWASSISWLGDAYAATAGAAGADSAGTEIDTYFGISNSFATDFTYDVGFLRYNYPGTYPAGATKGDTNEIYGKIGYKWVSLKYSRSLGDTFGTASASGSDYLDLSASVPLADDFSVGAHYGKQKFKGPNAGTGNGYLGYSDYNVSVSKDMGEGYSVSLMYSNTNAHGNPGEAYSWGAPAYDAGKGTAVLTISKSM